MNRFEDGLLNPEPTPVGCYLQEEDTASEHALERYGAVCGRCYGALADLLRSAEDELRSRKAAVSGTPQPTPTSCFRACVATIFDIPVEDVPRACDGDSWDWTEFQRWLAERFKMQAVELWINPDRPILYPVPFRVPVIVTGPSPRPCPSGRHAVVGVTKGLDGFDLTHDPHESGLFLGGAEPTHVVFFAMMYPKIQRRGYGD